MVRKKSDSFKKAKSFAPAGKLLMIERNKSSLGTSIKSPRPSKSSPGLTTAAIAMPPGEKTGSCAKSPRPDKPKRRFRPGVKALREIKKFQSTTNLLVPKATFSRLVREMMQNTFEKPDFRFTTLAMVALQEATEMAIVNLLEVANLCCLHAKRVTLAPSDIKLTRRAFGLGHPVND